MPIRLDTLVSAIAAEVGLDPDNVAVDKARIIRFVNDTRLEISQLPIEWSVLETFGEISTIVNATGGTVTVTKNLAEVTGSSTSFTTAMAGASFLKVTDNDWRRIIYVTDTTHLTLESGWPGDGVTAGTYRIWKRFYERPSNVEKILSLSNSAKTGQLAAYDNYEFDTRFEYGIDAFGDPLAFTDYGNSELGLEYLKSTVFTSVSSTANSPILDFSGTGLVSALAPGDRLLLGNSTTSTAFYVDRILTDTKASLRNYVQIGSAALSATAFALERRYIQFYPAVDAIKVFFYKARKKVYELFNNNDYLEDGWYTAVKKGSIAKAMGYINSPKETQKLAEYNSELQMLSKSQFKLHNPVSRLKPYIPNRYGGSGKFTKDANKI